jgi:hypothetical protein
MELLIMENSSLPAFPMTVNRGHEISFENSCFGLTKREYFAIKIMAGFATDPRLAPTIDSIEMTAELSFRWADALLAAGEK